MSGIGTFATIARSRMDFRCRCKSGRAADITANEQWRRVLGIEVQRWSAMTPDQLASALNKEQVYEVELDSKTYQVEVGMQVRERSLFRVSTIK